MGSCRSKPPPPVSDAEYVREHNRKAWARQNAYNNNPAVHAQRRNRYMLAQRRQLQRQKLAVLRRAMAEGWVNSPRYTEGDSRWATDDFIWELNATKAEDERLLASYERITLTL